MGVLHSLCTCSEERRSRGLTGPIPCCAALERPCSGTRPPAVVGTSRRSLKSKPPAYMSAKDSPAAAGRKKEASSALRERATGFRPREPLGKCFLLHAWPGLQSSSEQRASGRGWLPQDAKRASPFAFCILTNSESISTSRMQDLLFGSVKEGPGLCWAGKVSPWSPWTILLW